MDGSGLTALFTTGLTSLTGSSDSFGLTLVTGDRDFFLEPFGLTVGGVIFKGVASSFRVKVSRILVPVAAASIAASSDSCGDSTSRVSCHCQGIWTLTGGSRLCWKIRNLVSLLHPYLHHRCFLRLHNPRSCWSWRPASPSPPGRISPVVSWRREGRFLSGSLA